MSLAPIDSAGGPAALWQRFALFALLVGLVAGAVLAPMATLSTLYAGAALLIGATVLLRLVVVVAALGRSAAPTPPPVAEDDLPTIALLIPLYREDGSLPILIEALDRLDYPRDALIAALLIEPEDDETRAALDQLPLPDWFRAVPLPEGTPRTKPRALNAALARVDAELVGIYDAEDQPAPDQLRRVAAAFAAAAPRTAVVQARLAYYNPTDAWLARCFALEYALWFDILLNGIRRLGLPMPLGGASVFFDVGGWDAHNVTEDADLGVRLHRRGYRAALVESTTLEEANCRLWPWIRQRSRWIKGYMQTWRTHMRRPARLLRELGLWPWIGFQLLFLGAIVAHLAQPLFWGALLWFVLANGAAGAAAALWPVLVGVLALGQVAMIAVAAVAARRLGLGGLACWAPTLALYWPLAAIAAYKALGELVVAPSYWDKTAHGVSPTARRMSARAATRLARAAAQPASSGSSAPRRSRS